MGLLFRCRILVIIEICMLVDAAVLSREVGELCHFPETVIGQKALVAHLTVVLRPVDEVALLGFIFS